MAQCEPFIPSAPHGSCHVSVPWGAIWHPHDHAMCHPIPGVSKNMKFRLSLNPTKFDGVTRFRETNSMVESISSSEIYKNPSFSSGTIPTNYRFTLFLKNLNLNFPRVLQRDDGGRV